MKRLLLFLLLTPSLLSAKDGDTFYANSIEGISVLYQVISEAEKTVRVGAETSTGYGYEVAIETDATGPLTIPAEVNGYRVTEIYLGAFFWRSGITEVFFPEGLEHLGHCFYQNGSLRRFNLPSTLTSYEASFVSCESIEEIIVPDCATEIMVKWISSSNVKSVKLPSTITKIGSEAFIFVPSLSGLFLNSVTPPETHEKAFYSEFYSRYYESYQNITVFVPAGSVETYRATVPWNNFTEIREPYAEGEVFTWTDKTGLEWEFKVTSATDLTVQLGSGTRPAISTSYGGNINMPTFAKGYKVTSIAANAFEGCTGISAVTANYDYPMAFPTTAFPTSVYTNGYLYIPEDLRLRYEVLEGWNSFLQVNPGNYKLWDTFLAVNPEGIEIAYTVIDATKKLVEVEDYRALRDDPSTYRALDKNTEGHVTIPDYVNGYKVTEIGTEAFMECTKITSVRLPNSITTISHEAFSSCVNLTSINMPAALQVIERWAFWDCHNLTSLNIPKGVTAIGKEAFRGCSGLGDLMLPSTLETLDEGAFISCSGLGTLCVEAGNPYYDTRDDCNALIHTATNTIILGSKNTVIPTSVNQIGAKAFAGIKDLTEINIPAWITDIGEGAYQNCSNVKRVILNGAPAIGDKAFNKMNSDCRVYIFSDNIPSCTSGAFSPKQTLYVPIGKRADYEAATEWSSFAAIKEMYPLGTETFTTKTAEDVDLTIKILDPYELTAQVGDGTHAAIATGTEGIITIPATAGDYTCPTITTNAFKDCAGLKKIVILDDITDIMEGAAGGTTLPDTIVCQAASPYDIDANAFSTDIYKQSVLYVNDEHLEDAFTQAEGWKHFTHITSPLPDITGLTSFQEKTIEGVNVTYTIIDAEARTVKVGNGTSNSISSLTTGTVTLPSQVRKCNIVEIAPKAFQFCSKITTVTLPESIVKIGNNAFSGCRQLASVNIPDHVTTIEESAFYNNSLTTIRIPRSVTTLGEWNFQECNQLTYVDVEVEQPLPLTYSFFSNRANATLHVPVGCKDAYQRADYWKEFKRIVEGKVYPETTETFVCQTAEGKELTFRITSHEDFTAVVGDGTHAALSSTAEGKVTIPTFAEAYTVTGIATNAFKDCAGLTEVCIEDNITAIESQAFSGCTALTTVQCMAHAAYDIAADAFDNETYANATLLVGQSLETDFANAEGWKHFNHIDNTFIAGNFFTATTAEGIEVTYTVIDPHQKTVMVGGQPGAYDWQKQSAIASSASGDLVIPSEVNGYTVTEIANDAFCYNYGITSLTIPKSVVKIGTKIVVSCSALTAITVEEGNPVYDSRNNCNAIIHTASNTLITGCATTVVPDDIKVIGSYALYMTKGITSVTLPEGLTTIGDYAFAYTDLPTVTIPESVTTIGSSAFSGDALNAVITKWSTPTVISSYTFPSKANITLYVPYGSKETYTEADNWKDFKEIVEYYYKPYETFTATTDDGIDMTFRILDYEKMTVQVGDGVNTAVNTDISDITIPTKIGFYDVVTIGSKAFSGCTALTTVTCNAEAAYPIAADAFDAGTYSTAMLKVTAKLTDDFKATEGWKLFTHVGSNLEAGDAITATTAEGIEVTYTVIDPFKKTVMVGGQPGEYSSWLQSAIASSASGALVIPSEINGYTVTEIANDAFSYNYGMTSLTIPQSVTKIGSGIVVSCSALTAITVEEGNPVYDSRNNCNAIIETNTNKLLAGCATTVIPDNITAIADQAFYFVGSLKAVTLPKGLTSIGENAFAYTGLTTIDIPGSVTSFGWGPFNGCNSLSTVKVYWDTPLPASDYTFKTRANITLIIPFGSRAAYEAANYWNDFQKTVEVSDADGDGSVDVNDVTSTINHILSKPTASFIEGAADVDGDGTIDVNDVQGIIDRALGKVVHE